MELRLQEASGGDRPLLLDVRGVVLCGYTGRDQGAVRRHIEELEKEGVAPPPSVPTFYPKPYTGIQVAGEVVVEGKETSGEVEFVLFPSRDSLYVALGSDHTDRELERLNIRKAKQVCPAIVSRTVWDYESVKDHWDCIEIRSWCVCDGKRMPYQNAKVSSMLPPEDLLRRVGNVLHTGVDGLSVYSGTPPLISGNFVYAERFEAEMYDPVLQRKLSLGYRIQTVDWFKDEAGELRT